MANDNGTDNRVTEWVRWTARIWGGVVFLLAMLIFASNVWGWVTNGTADPYAVGDYPPIENVPPLLMLVGAVGSAIAWRWGGAGRGHHRRLPAGGPSDPADPLADPGGLSALPGVLFLACWWRSRGSRGSATGA